MDVKTVSSNSLRSDAELVSDNPATTENVKIPSVVTVSTIEELPQEKAIISTAIKPEDALQYDPTAIAAYYRNKPLRILSRIWAVLFPSLSFAFGLWWDRQRGRTVAHLLV